MSRAYEKLNLYIEKNKALSSVLTILNFDMDTIAPKESIAYNAKIYSILSKESYETLINDDVYQLLLAAQKEELTEVEQGVVKQLLKDYEKLRRIPKQEYADHQELITRSQNQWLEAKNKDDFSLFAPYLKKIIENERRFAELRRKDQETLYDVLLDDYEEGMTVATLDVFFNQLKEKLVPLIKEISKTDKVIDTSFLHQSYSIEAQRSFSHWLAQYLGFDFNRGILKETEHPYTTGTHNKDVRITTHYYEDRLESAIFSTIHETGHGIYEQGIRDDIALTPLGKGTSMGMHESQSRFYENCIGRSSLFWKGVYPKLVTTFKDQLEQVTLDAFVKAINESKPSLIRIEADELTYPLHILIRYEIEKKLFNENFDIDQLPELWNQLYQDYLGIRPKNNQEGILQDVHWSSSLFGYFPTYALGSAIAAQLYYHMKQELPLETWIEQGNFHEINHYLNQHIHQYGSLMNTNEILLKMMGQSFNSNDYIDYLVTKYQEIYQIKGAI